jgi:hypothetical protein
MFNYNLLIKTKFRAGDQTFEVKNCSLTTELDLAGLMQSTN